MANDVSFQLDIDEASEILTDMVMPTIKQSTEAIAYRASAMAASMSGAPPTFTILAEVGTIRRGRRAIGTVVAPIDNNRDSYIAHTALAKALDAGRV